MNFNFFPPPKLWPWKAGQQNFDYSIFITWPRLSIVTPNYNQAEFLEQTIQSVLQQDYPNLENIIMDGGSDDGSIEIIKKYSGQLAYWVSELDDGQSQAINKGISKHVS